MPARKLASLIGKIVSMSIGLGPVTRLMTRALYTTLHQKVAWCQNLTGLVKFCILMDKISGPNLLLSGWYILMLATGYGGYIVEHGNLIANGVWSKDEAAQSSTWRELRAVKAVLESF